MKTAIELARAAGNNDLFDSMQVEFLERLVDLARAEEREKYKWDVHSCGPTCTKAACLATREAVGAEREACCSSEVLEAANILGSDKPGTVVQKYQAAIRARGQS